MGILSKFSLAGKAALVTGGKKGLGKAMALGFADAGADVAICSRGIADGELEATAKEIRQLGRRSLAIQADVASKSDVDRMIEQAKASGRISGVPEILVPGEAELRAREKSLGRGVSLLPSTFQALFRYGEEAGLTTRLEIC